MSPLITAGNLINSFAILLQTVAYYVANVALAVAIALVLIRFLADRYNLNPFGRLVYYTRRPTEKWFYEIKGSQFYRPIKQALGFEPIWVMLLLAFVILFFLLRGLVDYTTTPLAAARESMPYFRVRDTLFPGRALFAAALIGTIYFTMPLI